MERKRIWFNHWFSTAYNIVNLIKENPFYEFTFVGSSELETSVLKGICEEWYKEPEDCSDEEYIDFCVRFCKEHEIDVFMPHRKLLVISRYKNRIEATGVKVLVDDYEIVSVLNNKEKSYRFFSEISQISIPKYEVVTKLEDFEKAYSELEKEFHQVCVKFVHDEGGKSYRLIDNSRTGYTALFKKQNTRMTYDLLKNALSEREVFSPLMVMPYLSGDEISVDCLKTRHGDIMIPRVKGIFRYEKVAYDDSVMELCDIVLKHCSLECPCNVQFKYHEGIPYFLEVNTRMSGGIHMSCLASGVNIPSIAVSKLFGKEENWSLNKRACSVSHVEVPVILETDS